MKRYFVLILVVFNIISLFYLKSNDNNKFLCDILKFEKQLVLPLGINYDSDVFLQFTDNKLYILPRTLQSLKDELILFRFDLSTDIMDTINIPHKFSFVNSFKLTNKYLILVIDNNLVVFLVDKKGSTLNFTEYAEINVNYYYYKPEIIVNNDIMKIYECILSSERINEKTQFSCQTIDLLKKKIIDNTYLTNPKGLPMMWFRPRNIINSNDSLLVISDITEYNLNIYDHSNSMILNKSFNYKFKGKFLDTAFNSKLSSANYKSIYPKNEIEKLRSLTGDIPLIHNVNFINDSLLLIARSEPLGGNYNYNSIYDILKVKNNEIEIIYNDLLDISKDSIIYPDRINFNQNYYISNGYLFCIKPIPFEIKSQKINYSEMEEKTNEFYKTNDIKISLFIYSFNIN